MFLLGSRDECEGSRTPLTRLEKLGYLRCRSVWLFLSVRWDDRVTGILVHWLNVSLYGFLCFAWHSMLSLISLLFGKCDTQQWPDIPTDKHVVCSIHTLSWSAFYIALSKDYGIQPDWVKFETEVSQCLHGIADGRYKHTLISVPQATKKTTVPLSKSSIWLAGLVMSYSPLRLHQLILWISY